MTIVLSYVINVYCIHHLSIHLMDPINWLNPDACVRPRTWISNTIWVFFFFFYFNGLRLLFVLLILVELLTITAWTLLFINFVFKHIKIIQYVFLSQEIRRMETPMNTSYNNIHLEMFYNVKTLKTRYKLKYKILEVNITWQ